MNLYERAKADHLTAERTSPAYLMRNYSLTYDVACTLFQMLWNWAKAQRQPFQRIKGQKKYPIIEEHKKMLINQ